MLLFTRAMYATPLVAAALVALLSPKDVAAHVVPFQPRMSGLHSRQIDVPENCFATCDDVINLLDVSELQY